MTLDELLEIKLSFRPETVCLCGSTRFSKQFTETNLELTLQGIIVLSIGCDKHSDRELELDQATCDRLDALHLYKIDRCDRVHVLNVGGYIGTSTAREIEYAMRIGKPVTYLEPPRAGGSVKY